MANGSRIVRSWQFCVVNSFTQIINWLTDVLKEKLVISSPTFLMVLCKVFKLSFDGSLSVTIKPWSSKYKRQSFLRKPKTPVIPAVFHGLACSSGPRNISYKRSVSAPYSLQISSGLTTLYFDLDIFSTSRPTMYFPLSSLMNLAYLYSSLQFLNSSILSSSEELIKETSTWIGDKLISLEMLNCTLGKRSFKVFK